MACCNGRRRVQDPLNALSPSLPSHFLAPPEKMKFRLRLLPLREQRGLRGLRKLQRMFYEQHLSMPGTTGAGERRHGRQAATNAPSGAIWCRAPRLPFGRSVSTRDRTNTRCPISLWHILHIVSSKTRRVLHAMSSGGMGRSTSATVRHKLCLYSAVAFT